MTEAKEITVRQATLVKDSWEISIMPTYEKFAMDFFVKLFAKEPEIREQFPFLSQLGPDERIEDNPRLQKHANNAFLTAGNAMASLLDEDTALKVKKTVRLLGKRHAKYGMKASHLPVVGETLIGILTTSCKSLWSDEIEAAWGKAIAIVAGEMAVGLKEGLEAAA